MPHRFTFSVDDTSMPTLSFDAFLKTPPGRLLERWELARFADALGHAFGDEAIQVGAPGLNVLHAHRFRSEALLMGADEVMPCGQSPSRIIFAEPEYLPIKSNSIDLAVLPHTLDFSSAPQQVLREAVRILAPEGRLILSSFNTLGLWWLRHRTCVAMGGKPYLPTRTNPVPLTRLQDWLALLGLEVDRGIFGIYAPGFQSDARLAHWRWLDKAGDRWMPQCSNLFILQAVKRIPGTRLITPARRLTPTARQEKMPVPSASLARHAPEDTPEPLQDSTS